MYKNLFDLVTDRLNANEHNDREYNEWFAMRSLLTVVDALPLAASAQRDVKESIALEQAREMLDRSLTETAALPSMHGSGQYVTVRMERRPLSRIADRLIDDDFDDLYSVMNRFLQAVIGVMLYADESELDELRDKFNYAASICRDLEQMRSAFLRLDEINEITFIASPTELYVLQNEIQTKLSRFGITVTPGKTTQEIVF